MIERWKNTRHTKPPSDGGEYLFSDGDDYWVNDWGAERADMMARRPGNRNVWWQNLPALPARTKEEET